MQKTQHQTPLGQLWNSIQSWLFPVLEDEIGALARTNADGAVCTAILIMAENRH